LVALCQHSQEETSNNPKQVLEYNYELPFDIQASRKNNSFIGKRIFRDNLLEVYCQMSNFRKSTDIEHCKLVKSNADCSTQVCAIEVLSGFEFKGTKPAICFTKVRQVSWKTQSPGRDTPKIGHLSN
jgi:hypothetical protein